MWSRLDHYIDPTYTSGIIVPVACLNVLQLFWASIHLHVLRMPTKQNKTIVALSIQERMRMNTQNMYQPWHPWTYHKV